MYSAFFNGRSLVRGVSKREAYTAVRTAVMSGTKSGYAPILKLGHTYSAIGTKK